MEHNFNKINTLNQGTPYDYNSVMQYHRLVMFSRQNTVYIHATIYSSASACLPLALS